MIGCKICRGIFDDTSSQDRKLHANEHKKIAKGALPRVIREFMKAFGYAVAHNDGGLERLQNHYDPDIGKLAVAYSWWTRALSQGIDIKEFDDYMKAHLQFADSLVTGVGLKESQFAIKKWERYAG